MFKFQSRGDASIIECKIRFYIIIKMSMREYIFRLLKNMIRTKQNYEKPSLRQMKL